MTVDLASAFGGGLVCVWAVIWPLAGIGVGLAAGLLITKDDSKPRPHVRRRTNKHHINTLHQRLK